MEIYNDELKCRFLRREPRDGTDAKKILEEVEKRKKIAKEKGLDRLITHIYFEYIDHFFRWSCGSIKDYFKHSYPEVLNLLKEIKKVEYSGEHDSDVKFKSIILYLNKKQYRFDFRKKSFSLPDEYCTHGLLELYEEGDKKLLALNLSLEWSENAYCDPEWRPFEIVAFIEGEWIKDFETLKQAILLDKENKAIRESENSSKMELLKKNFGIE